MQLHNSNEEEDDGGNNKFSLTNILIETINALIPKTENELLSLQRLIEKPCK